MTARPVYPKGGKSAWKSPHFHALGIVVEWKKLNSKFEVVEVTHRWIKVPQDTSMLNGSLSEFAEANRVDESLFKAILRKMDFSRIQFEKKMEDFSAGQKKKVLIAKSLCEQAHLYVWDEPLNYIDIYSRMQIENLIREFSPTMIFVEHDLAFRNNMATKSIRLATE